MKKKVLSVLLSTAMAASMLAGCGGSDTPAAPAADNGGSQDTASSEADGNAEAPAASEGVEEITWMFWDDLNATEDLISIGYKDTVERFNKEIGRAHV